MATGASGASRQADIAASGRASLPGATLDALAPTTGWAAWLIAWARRRPHAPLLLALGLGLLLRIGLLLRTGAMIDGDEALVGIQAQHILQGARPVYFYGQAYMGSLEAYLAAGVFARLRRLRVGIARCPHRPLARAGLSDLAAGAGAPAA